MNLMELRAAAYKAAQGITKAAEAESRDMTADELKAFEGHIAEVEALDVKIKAAQESKDAMSKLTSLGIEVKEPERESEDAGGSVGERFVKSAGFKSFRESHPSGIGSGTPVRVEAKGVGSVRGLVHGTKATITTQTGNPSAQRESGYYSNLPGDDRLDFLDLITLGSTDVSYSEYAQIVSENNNAAVVAEGDLKPLSDVTTNVVDSKAFTYADGFDVTNQTLADDGALVAFMNSRVSRHVRGAIHDGLLNGSGTGTNPTGILNTTGTLSQAFSGDAIETLSRALEAFEAANRDSDPQAIVMNPTDVWNLRRLKDSDGRYLLGNPLEQGPVPTPWGVPLVRSSHLTAGTALVGRFDSVNYLELDPIRVEAFNQHKDYAQRNMVYVRAEARGRQLFYAPREVVVATLTGA